MSPQRHAARRTGAAASGSGSLARDDADESGRHRRGHRARRSTLASPMALGLAALTTAGLGGGYLSSGSWTPAGGPADANRPGGAPVSDLTAAAPGARLVDDLRAQANSQRAAAQESARRQAAAQATAVLERATRQSAAPASRTAQRRQLDAFVLPVDLYTLTGRFGQAGPYWSQRHTGLDFAAPTGTTAKAVTAGVITQAGWAGPYGYRIIETLPDGTELWYCHLSLILLSWGAVHPGQTIARVGATGNVSGPHLHLEVRPGGRTPIDPLPWLRARGLRP